MDCIMDLRRLEAFCKVYELKSFSKAGQDLFLSQPTISAHIATLEEELGIPLFDRVGRGILATQAGDILYAHAQKIFRDVEQAHAEIQLLMNKVAGDLFIGGSTIPANYLLPFLLAEFARECPEVKVSLSVGDSAEILEQLLSGRLIVGIVGAREEHKDLVYLPMMKDELVVVAPRGKISAGTVITEPEQLLTLPWVLREKGSGTRKAMEEAFSTLGIDLRHVKTSIQVQSTGAVLRCVQAGLGLSVTSRLAASADIERGDMDVVEIKGLEMERFFFAVHHKGRKFFPAATRFIEFLKRKYQQTMEAA
jgi:LysR family transcriptional regulator, transcriptional activator of the cysJI operon